MTKENKETVKDQSEKDVNYKVSNKMSSFRMNKAYSYKDPMNRDKVVQFTPDKSTSLSKQATKFESLMLRGLIVEVDDTTDGIEDNSEVVTGGTDGNNGGTNGTIVTGSSQE